MAQGQGRQGDPGPGRRQSRDGFRRLPGVEQALLAGPIRPVHLLLHPLPVEGAEREQVECPYFQVVAPQELSDPLPSPGLFRQLRRGAGIPPDPEPE